MDDITEVRITDCDESMFLKPSRMHYKQNGNPRAWDLMKVHDSVAIVIYNTTKRVLIFVKQFRPAVYYNATDSEDKSIDTEKYPGKLGITLELCAGIVDKDLILGEIAREEILEECGYDVPISNLEKVTSFRSGVGISGSLQTLFYAEVTDDMKISKGGGNICEGEFIEVVEMTIPEVQSMIYDESIPRAASFLFGIMWFLDQKVPNIRLQNKL